MFTKIRTATALLVLGLTIALAMAISAASAAAETAQGAKTTTTTTPTLCDVGSALGNLNIAIGSMYKAAGDSATGTSYQTVGVKQIENACHV
jgi:hypothetical protein